MQPGAPEPGRVIQRLVRADALWLDICWAAQIGPSDKSDLWPQRSLNSSPPPPAPPPPRLTRSGS